MLLICERHKPADLQAWNALHEADLAWFQIGNVEAKAMRAIDEIRAFSRSGPCYASTSWGKDSTVVSHLVWRSGLPVPLANVAQVGLGQDLYVSKVRDEFLCRFGLDYHEEVVDLVDIPIDAKHSPALDIGINRLRLRYGTRRYIGGVRADESGLRKISLRSQGLSTASSCRPIGFWSHADVFAYLARYDLPVHPNYGMTGGGRWDREQLRVSIIGGPKGRGMGRHEWETEYYPDVLRRMRVRPKRCHP